MDEEQTSATDTIVSTKTAEPHIDSAAPTTSETVLNEPELPVSIELPEPAQPVAIEPQAETHLSPVPVNEPELPTVVQPVPEPPQTSTIKPQLSEPDAPTTQPSTTVPHPSPVPVPAPAPEPPSDINPQLSDDEVVASLTEDQLKAAATLYIKKNQKLLSQKGVAKRKQTMELNLREIVDFLSHNNGSPLPRIAHRTNITSGTTSKYLRQLIASGKVTATGWGKTRLYFLK